ncbi:hypothetical protein [Methylobacillus sp. Pita1]|uniref:hypothetical protein n=1 Tax=Methylobacillus sp. Pita1 TaxID=3382642 RepID=UPI0038B5CBA8
MTPTKSCPVVLRNGGEIEDSPRVAELFKNANMDGTFVFHDVIDGKRIELGKASFKALGIL